MVALYHKGMKTKLNADTIRTIPRLSGFIILNKGLKTLIKIAIVAIG